MDLGQLEEDIENAIDSKESIVGVLIDFKKVIDTIDHRKLKRYKRDE